MKSTHLIIGAGPAALAAAQAIRTRDKTATITLVTRENALPYSPAVLPYLISGELKEKDLFVKGEAVLKAMNLQILLCKDVAEVVHSSNEVLCTDGERIGYEQLLVATGASPQVPPIDNAAAENIHTFRTYADFERLSKTLTGPKHIAIYGAGLVAVEAAEKLCMAGHSVTIIARSSLLRKYFSPKNVAVLEKACAKNGARIITRNTLVSVVRSNDRLILTLSNGDELIADELIVATGVAPNAVKNPSFVKVAENLRVGRHMETALPNVYAAGDVVASPSFFDGEYGSCAILPEAVYQGRVAGANMAGNTVAYGGWVPCNTLRCFDNSMFSIGLSASSSDTAYENLTVEDGASSLRLTLKGDFLVGAEGLNMNSIHPGVLLYLTRERVPVKPYKELLMSKRREAACWLMQQHRKSQAI